VVNSAQHSTLLFVSLWEQMGSGSSFLSQFSSSTVKSDRLSIHDNDRNDLRIQRFIAPYCPHHVLKFLGNKTLYEPISTSLKGACLLADICGFTKFSGDLCKEGGTGIDKLRITTSSFLTKFIETVYLYYGDGMLPSLVRCLLIFPVLIFLSFQ
jgi:hypothetical protein